MATSISSGGSRVPTIKTVSVTKVLAAASAYDATDVLGETTCTTTNTAWTFAAVVRSNGGSGRIIGATVISESEEITPTLVLFLFTATPTSSLADHSLNTGPDSADLANYIGKIVFPAMTYTGTTDSNATVTPSDETGNLPMPFTCASDADDLIGILATTASFTQTAGDDMTVKLTIEQY